MDKPNNIEKDRDVNIFAFLNKVRKCTLIIAIASIGAVFGAIMSIIGPEYLSKLVEKIQEGISDTTVNINLSDVNKIGIILIIIYGLSMLFNYFQAYLLNNLSYDIGKRLRTSIIQKIDRLPLNYFDNHNFGDILSYITNDITAISNAVMNGGTFISSVITFFGCIIIMFVIEWRLAITAIASSILGFLGISIILVNAQKYFDSKQQDISELNDYIDEHYYAQSIIRAYNAEEKCYKIFNEKNQKLKNCSFKAQFYSQLMTPIMIFVGDFGYVAVSIIGSILAFKGIIGFPIIVAFMVYVKLFSAPLTELGEGFANLQKATAAIKRVSKFLDNEELSDETEKKKKLDYVDGYVSFDHISFGYLPEKTIINDFTYYFGSGQKIAIVGPTGAGKTTIVNLLMRFYELNSGSINVDGISLLDIKRENVCKVFGMVLQDTWLFSGTIRENIRYNSNVSDEKIIEICSRCGLMHFINSLPNGLDAMVEDGLSISVGQKQLITIARAMADNSPIMILDEATSSVDARTEILIQNAMDKLCENRTSFVIAHRLSTIKNADVIIYMKDGDIVETGKHNELIEKNGAYAELYYSQFESVT